MDRPIRGDRNRPWSGLWHRTPAFLAERTPSCLVPTSARSRPEISSMLDGEFQQGLPLHRVHSSVWRVREHVGLERDRSPTGDIHALHVPLIEVDRAEATGPP